MGIGYEEVAILSFLIAVYFLLKPLYYKSFRLWNTLFAFSAIFVMLLSTLSAISRRLTSLKSSM